MLFDIMFPMLLIPNSPAKNQTETETIPDEFITEIRFAFSSIIKPANTKMRAEIKLPIRKEKGNILYFPPHAKFPNGAPKVSTN